MLPIVIRLIDPMQRFYLVPIEVIPNPPIGDYRGPKYFRWRFNPGGIDCRWSFMRYGFTTFGLLLALDITQVDHDALVLNPDVYAYPEVLDQSIAPGDNLDSFFEGVGVPTDWLTPSTTYLEFLRIMAAMFQFNQRYGGRAAEQTGEYHSLIDDAGGLNTRYNNWSQQTRDWFVATLADFGYDQAIPGNPTLRQLLKRVGDAWGARQFRMGGVMF